MPISALEICQKAYKKTNPGQALTSLTQTAWPYSIALDLLNDVISELNIYNYYFMEAEVDLPFTTGVNSFNLTDLEINPKAIVKVQSSNGVDGIPDSVYPMNYYDFILRWPTVVLSNQQPRYYSHYGNTLYLNNSPLSDYGVKVYHLAKIPIMTNENSILPVPPEYEHVFKDGVNSKLLIELDRPDANLKYQLWEKKIKDMVAAIEIDYGMATQFPAKF